MTVTAKEVAKICDVVLLAIDLDALLVVLFGRLLVQLLGLSCPVGP